MADSSTLYLDTTEEITAVIDRLGDVKSETVDLVVPAQAALFQSVVNLRLLARAAKRLGKTLTITTRDETGQHLAIRAGLAVREQLGGPVIAGRRVVQHAPSTPVVRGEPQSVPAAEVAIAPAEKKGGAGSEKASQALVTSTGRRMRKEGKTSARQVKLLPDWPWKKIGLVTTAVIVVGFFVLTFPLASATIRVIPKQQQATLDVEVVATPEPKSDRGEVSGRIVEITREGKRMIPPTGTKESGTKATGSITISNTYSDQPQAFGVNTRIQEPGGHVFLLTAQVTIPGAKVDKGKTVAGTVTTTVVGEKFGEDYNLGPTTFAFIDLTVEQQAGISAQSSAAFSGGTKKEVKTLSSTDVEGSVKTITDELSSALTGEIRGQLAGDEELLDPAIKVETRGTASSIKVGAETDAAEVEVKTTVVVRGFVAKPAEIDAVAAEALRKQLPINQALLEDAPSSVTHAFKSIDFKQRRLVLSAHAERLAVYTIDQQSVADQVAGKTRGHAETVIQNWPEVQEVKVNLAPFWRFHLPGKSRIKVEVGL